MLRVNLIHSSSLACNYRKKAPDMGISLVFYISRSHSCSRAAAARVKLLLSRVVRNAFPMKAKSTSFASSKEVRDRSSRCEKDRTRSNTSRIFHGSSEKARGESGKSGCFTQILALNTCSSFVAEPNYPLKCCCCCCCCCISKQVSFYTLHSARVIAQMAPTFLGTFLQQILTLAVLAALPNM